MTIEASDRTSWPGKGAKATNGEVSTRLKPSEIAGCPATHMPLVARISGVLRHEMAKVVGTLSGEKPTLPPAFRSLVRSIPIEHHGLAVEKVSMRRKPSEVAGFSARKDSGAA